MILISDDQITHCISSACNVTLHLVGYQTAMVCFKRFFSWPSPKNLFKMIISKCTSNLNMKRNKIKPMKTKHQTYQEWIAACLDCMFWLPRSSTGRKLQRDNTYLKRDFAQLSSIVQVQPSA